MPSRATEMPWSTPPRHLLFNINALARYARTYDRTVAGAMRDLGKASRELVFIDPALLVSLIWTALAKPVAGAEDRFTWANHSVDDIEQLVEQYCLEHDDKHLEENLGVLALAVVEAYNAAFPRRNTEEDEVSSDPTPPAPKHRNKPTPATS